MIDSKQFYQSMSSLCVKGVVDSCDLVKGLMNKQLRDAEWASTLVTEEITSTAICLIGLFRSGMVSMSGLDVAEVLTALSKASKKHRYPGGIGLIIWANAVADGSELANLLLDAGYPDLETNHFTASLTTMESSWLLSGLLHEYRRVPAKSTRELILIVMADVMGRFNDETSIFCHATAHASVKDRLRKHIANFADQIYSIQALSYAAIVLGETEPMYMARSCALRLIDLQGPLGQWWWHYNSKSGLIAQGFPVYSVHQHSMAPMALMALTAANGGDFAKTIALSQQWLSHNELGVNLIDLARGTIWRDISPKENYVNKSVGQVRELLGIKQEGKSVSPDKLIINYETRPYEWAWCLFAGAMSADPPPPAPFIV